MKRILFLTILLSILLLIFGCTAQTNLSDYQPKSAEEKEVLDFMLKWEDNQKERNLTKYMACFHDNATIKYNSDSKLKPIISKQQFEDRLKSGHWAEMDTNNMITPTITIVRNRATVRCKHYAESYIIVHNIDLIKEGEKWSIIKWNWEWH